MTTTALFSSRAAPHGEILVAPSGPIGADAVLIFDDVLTRDELVVEVEKIKTKLLEIDFPVV